MLYLNFSRSGLLFSWYFGEALRNLLFVTVVKLPVTVWLWSLSADEESAHSQGKEELSLKNAFASRLLTNV